MGIVRTRWGSFEAEAWPMRLYRYDAMTPHVTALRGFGGYASYPHSPYGPNAEGVSGPIYMVFGEKTVFTAASVAGAQHFLTYDYNVFRMHTTSCATGGVAAARMRAPIPFLYRIKADSHRAAAFRDLMEGFGTCFMTLCMGGRNEPLQGWRPARSPTTRFPLGPDLVNFLSLLGFYRNDEVHVAAPVTMSPLGGGEGCGDISFISFEWLDLAVDMRGHHRRHR